jgi:cell division GTPase FtsZ
MDTGLRIREDNQKKKIEENFSAVNNTLAGVVSTMTSMMTTSPTIIVIDTTY